MSAALKFVVIATDVDGTVLIYGTPTGRAFITEQAAEREAELLKVDVEDVRVLPILRSEGGAA